MIGAHKHLTEITYIVRGDMTANLLMDKVLSACFDCALGKTVGSAENQKDADAQLISLVVALQRFNFHLAGYGEVAANGLFHGNPQEISAWAEELTMQILTNRPH